MSARLPGAGLIAALRSDLPAERAATVKRIAELDEEVNDLRAHLGVLDSILRAADLDPQPTDV